MSVCYLVAGKTYTMGRVYERAISSMLDFSRCQVPARPSLWLSQCRYSVRRKLPVRSQVPSHSAAPAVVIALSFFEIYGKLVFDLLTAGPTPTGQTCQSSAHLNLYQGMY